MKYSKERPTAKLVITMYLEVTEKVTDENIKTIIRHQLLGKMLKQQADKVYGLKNLKVFRLADSIFDVKVDLYIDPEFGDELHDAWNRHPEAFTDADACRGEILTIADAKVRVYYRGD